MTDRLQKQADRLDEIAGELEKQWHMQRQPPPISVDRKCPEDARIRLLLRDISLPPQI